MNAIGTIGAQALENGGSKAVQALDAAYQQALLGSTERSGLSPTQAAPQFLSSFNAAMAETDAHEPFLQAQADALAQQLQPASLPLVQDFLAQLAPYVQSNGQIIPTDASKVRALYSQTLTTFLQQNPGFDVTTGSLMLRTFINEGLSAAASKGGQT